MTALQTLIAGVLAGHWTYSTDTDGYPRFVDRCDGCRAIVFNHGRDDNQTKSYAAHQAAAVEAALTEAGNVEWGVRRVGYPAVQPQTEERARWMMNGVNLSGHLEELTTRVVGPWTKVAE